MAWNLKNEIGRKLIHLSAILLMFLYIIIQSKYGKEIGLFVLTIFLIFLSLYSHHFSDPCRRQLCSQYHILKNVKQFRDQDPEYHQQLKQFLESNYCKAWGTPMEDDNKARLHLTNSLPILIRKF